MKLMPKQVSHCFQDQAPVMGLDNLQGCLVLLALLRPQASVGVQHLVADCLVLRHRLLHSGLLGAVPLLLRLPARLGRRVLLLGVPTQ
jgi:hypothetical protein